MFFTSHLFLCLVATQVFQQVWNLATDAPITGLIITMWLCWWLGCLAGYADITTIWSKQERLIAADVQEFQAWFDALPLSERLECQEQWAVTMSRLKATHQRVVDMRDKPFDPPKILSLLPSPGRFFGRRRERKILATAEVKHP